MRDATTRRPAASSFAVIGPITFFATASGLMIENVRSIAIWGRTLVETSSGFNIGQARAIQGQGGRGLGNVDAVERCRRPRAQRRALAGPACAPTRPWRF